MWGSKKQVNKIDTIIAEGTKVEGDLKMESNLFVDGEVQGNIRSNHSQQALVSIGQNGQVHGDLFAPYVVIFGYVEGDVHASEKVELKPGAKVEGNLYYKVMEMNAGAAVNGKMVAMGEAAQLEHNSQDSQTTGNQYNVAKRTSA